MKKALIASALFGTLSLFAQEPKNKESQLTSEQRVELQVKKMTLDLDLNDKQQKEVKKLLTDQSKKREEARTKIQANKAEDKKPTADERFAMRSKMLDQQIAFKGEMKKILNEKQMEKWEENRADRTEHRMERKMQHHKSRK